MPVSLMLMKKWDVPILADVNTDTRGEQTLVYCIVKVTFHMNKYDLFIYLLTNVDCVTFQLQYSDSLKLFCDSRNLQCLSN